MLPLDYATTNANESMSRDREVVVKAKSGRPKMHRATVARLLAEMLQRAAEINRNDSPYAWRVERLYVFGSHLKGADRSTDLDVVYVMDWLYGSGTDPRQLALEHARRALRKSTPTHFVDHLFYPHNEVLRHLKGRSGRITLHHGDHLEWLRENGEPVKLVFKRRATRIERGN
jgi:hypothetical protein